MQAYTYMCVKMFVKRINENRFRFHLIEINSEMPDLVFQQQEGNAKKEKKKHREYELTNIQLCVNMYCI